MRTVAIAFADLMWCHVTETSQNATWNHFGAELHSLHIVQKVACLPKSWPIVLPAHAPEGPEVGEPGQALRGGHGAGMFSET